MTATNAKTVRILTGDEENLSRSKDEEYAYWQSRPPLERLVATQELSFAFFEEHDNAAEVRRQFLRSPVSLRCQKSLETKNKETK